MTNNYKNISLEDIEKAVNEIYNNMPQKQKDDVFVRELNAEEIEDLRHVLGNFAIDSLGDRIFRLPGGAITGIGGVRQFNEAVKEQMQVGFKGLPKRYFNIDKKDDNGK